MRVYKWIKYAACAAACLVAVPALRAQIYRVYRPVPRLEAERQTNSDEPGRWEIAAAAAASFGTVKDADGYVLSQLMYGARGSVWVHLSDSIAAGAEMQMLRAADKRTPFLAYIRRRSTAVLLRWTITPQTEPGLYILAGAGRVRNQSAFELYHADLDADSRIWIAGAGGKLRLGRGWTLAGEYRLIYDVRPWKNFVLEASRCRNEFSAEISRRF